MKWVFCGIGAHYKWIWKCEKLRENARNSLVSIFLPLTHWTNIGQCPKIIIFSHRLHSFPLFLRLTTVFNRDFILEIFQTNKRLSKTKFFFSLSQEYQCHFNLSSLIMKKIDCLKQNFSSLHFDGLFLIT